MRPLSDEPNLNGLWGRLIIQELRRHGVSCFVVCPGSRSTPLARAVAELEDDDTCRVSWIDERGAGFAALGWARGSGSPAAVITTSGTAVANLLPAVVEADLDGVPLIVLSADRPPELRACGANQSIDQVGIFGRFVRYQFDLPAPTDQIPARFVLTTVDQAVLRALGPFPGPVQLNCAFRDPLPPVPRAYDRACLEGLRAWEADGETPLTQVHAAPPCTVHSLTGEFLGRALLEGETGLIVAGRLAAGETHSVLALAQQLGWALFPDLRSGLRLGPRHPQVLPHLDLLLGTSFRPKRLLVFGGRPLSQHLERWIAASEFTLHAVISLDPERLDPSHRATHRIVGDPAHVADALIESLGTTRTAPPPLPAGLLSAHARLDMALGEELDGSTQSSEPAVARWLSRHAPEGHCLFVSNSMPVRDLARFAVVGGPPLEVGANRGASGIDGVLATAAGVALARQGPTFGGTTLLIGDLALLHDLSSLASLDAQGMDLTVIVLNNGGGGIFSFLPIAKHPEVLTPWVQTPHTYRFEHVARAFGLLHREVSQMVEFEQAVRESWDQGGVSIVEVCSGLAPNQLEHERLEQALARAMGEPSA